MKTTKIPQHAEIKQTDGRKRLLTMLVALAALTTPSVTSRAAPLAHWTFDELSGSVAHDTVGSFNGNLSAGGSAFVSGGISGNAISLSRAANGFVTMGNVLGLTTGDFSLVAWVKMNAGDPTTDSLVLSKHEAWSLNGYILGINSVGGFGPVNKALFYEGTAGGSPVSTTSVNDGNWHQIVAVYQAGGNKSIYVDGSPAESIRASEPFIGNSSPFVIGGTGPVPTGQYSGLIDEVQIYDQVLSDSQISFLFQHPAQVVPEPGAMAIIGIGVFTTLVLRGRRQKSGTAG